MGSLFNYRNFVLSVNAIRGRIMKHTKQY